MTRQAEGRRVRFQSFRTCIGFEVSGFGLRVEDSRLTRVLWIAATNCHSWTSRSYEHVLRGSLVGYTMGTHVCWKHPWTLFDLTLIAAGATATPYEP